MTFSRLVLFLLFCLVLVFFDVTTTLADVVTCYQYQCVNDACAGPSPFNTACPSVGYCEEGPEQWCDNPNPEYCGRNEVAVCDEEPPPPPTTQCNDGFDNDGDTRIDYPSDPGCNSPSDNNENTDYPPIVDLRCQGGNGPCGISHGQLISLSWTSQYPAVCWAELGTPDWTDEGWNTDMPRNGSGDFGPVSGTVTYRFYCQNQLGVAQDSVTVTAGPAAPTVDILCNSTQGPCSIPLNSNVTLGWSSSNATSCTASGSWSGTKAITGSEVRTITATSNTFTLTCDGGGGSGNDSVVVNGTCSATAPTNSSESNITSNSARLNWTPGTGGSFQQLRVGPNQADVLSGCGGGTCVVVENNLSSATSFYDIPGGTLSPSTTYYWRVVNFNSAQSCWADRNDSFVTLANVAPSATNVKATEPDYCTYGPSITASWTYSDPEGTNQTSYHVQINDNPNFQGAMEYDSGKLPMTCLNNTTCSVFINSGMTWLTGYRLRVMVWDGADTPSAWVAQTQCQGPPGGNPSGCFSGNTRWLSPAHQYPTNVSSFTWTPVRPAVNQPVQFDDGSATCYLLSNPQIPVDCSQWNWTWGDGTSTNGTNPSPTKTYTTNGVYNVTLEVRDFLTYRCSATKQITVQRPIPNWKEVLPR